MSLTPYNIDDFIRGAFQQGIRKLMWTKKDWDTLNTFAKINGFAPVTKDGDECLAVKHYLFKV